MQSLRTLPFFHFRTCTAEVGENEMASSSALSARKASQALREAVEHHTSMVYRVAHRVLGNSADAEDVTQDVFLKLLKLSQSNNASARIPSTSEIRAWLARVTLNQALNQRRNTKSRKQRERVWTERRKEETVPAQ